MPSTGRDVCGSGTSGASVPSKSVRDQDVGQRARRAATTSIGGVHPSILPRRAIAYAVRGRIARPGVTRRAGGRAASACSCSAACLAARRAALTGSRHHGRRPAAVRPPAAHARAVARPRPTSRRAADRRAAPEPEPRAARTRGHAQLVIGEHPRAAPVDVRAARSVVYSTAGHHRHGRAVHRDADRQLPDPGPQPRHRADPEHRRDLRREVLDPVRRAAVRLPRLVLAELPVRQPEVQDRRARTAASTCRCAAIAFLYHWARSADRTSASPDATRPTSAEPSRDTSTGDVGAGHVGST